MPAPRTLILFAHPALEKSRVNRTLLTAVQGLDHVTLHDLYEAYPDFQIDVPREQALAEAHERIVLQHPFYWYSTPAIMKEWFDTVLQYGWAYGSEGTALHGKTLASVITAGGPTEAYGPGGYNTYPVKDYLKPFEQTARLCGMNYAEPIILHGCVSCTVDELDEWTTRYRNWLNDVSA